MTKRKYLLLLLAFQFSFLLSAKEEAIWMRHLDTATGLSNTRINSVYKDSDGFLWIGTSSGLCRYDGYDVKMYRDEHSEGTSGLNNYVERIYEDNGGRLWILAEGKYRIYNPDTGEVTDDIASYLKERGIYGDVTSVLAAGGRIWIAVLEKGIYALGSDGTGAVPVEGSKTSCKVTDMVKTDKGIVAVSTDGILSFIDPQAMKVVKKEKDLSMEKNGMESENIYAAYADREGRIWLFCNDLFMGYDTRTSKWLDSRLPPKGVTGVVKNMFQDSKGRLWIARDHRGLARMVEREEGFQIVEFPESGELKGHSTVLCFNEDADGTLWIGTFKQGLFSFNETVGKFGMEEFPDVNCMISAGGNSLWVGTDASGVWRWNLSDNSKERIIDPSEGVMPPAITCMAQGEDGTLYIGSFAKGLKKYRDGKFSRMVTGTLLDDSFPWSLTTDKEGNLWVGTLGVGLYRINTATGETKAFKGQESGLSSDYVMSLVCSRDGKMFIGTSYGISVYDPSSGKMTAWLNESDVPNPTSRSINQVYEDSRGLIWLATQCGLKVIDRQHKQIHDIDLRDGRNQFFVLVLIEDNGGAMWVSEGSNLVHLKVDFNERTGDLDVKSRVYDGSDGVQECELNQRSFAKLPDGEIVVGGLYGVNRISPYDIKFNTARPKVMFTDLYMGNRRIAAGEEVGGRVVYDKGLNRGATLEFDHNPEEFTIYFATDNYALPEKTVFGYKLEGFNDEWISCPRGVNHVTYTNLSPGHYRLLVKAVNGDGFESETPASINIYVHPPFWSTPWAYMVYAVLAIAIIYVIVRIVIARERKVFDRKRHEDTMRKQEEINQLKFKFFTNICHDLRTPLTLIVSPIESMLKESTDERQTKRLTLMRNNAMRLLSLVNQLLDFRKTEMAGLHLNPSEGDIVSFARGVCSSFMNLSERKNINLTFYSDRENIPLSFDADKMEKIFMNLLGNAFKFTPAGGRVDVSVECTGTDRDVLRIKVADTGPGVSDKDKPHIFERFYQVDDNGDPHPGMGSGIGLSMVSEYVRLHEGSIRVADNVEHGSVFIIEIPVRHSQAKTGETAFVEAQTEHPEAVAAHEPEETTAESADRYAADQRPVALVVDDNGDITDFIKDGIEDEFEVMTAADGEEALKKIGERKPSVIVADLMMPRMDGIELCRRLKGDKETAGIPVIILTAKHDLGAKVEGLTLGADDYMTKPFNLDVLRLRMRKLVQLTAKGAGRSLVDPEPENIKITPLDEKFIEKAVNYVTDNLDRSELSVEEMSEKLGMSRVRLYKKIKQITGKTPIEFIRVIRLKRAAQLLRESQLNVSEIAYQTGFNSPKVFSKYFKEEFGILPSVYQGKEGKETNYTV